MSDTFPDLPAPAEPAAFDRGAIFRAWVGGIGIAFVAGSLPADNGVLAAIAPFAAIALLPWLALRRHLPGAAWLVLTLPLSFLIGILFGGYFGGLAQDAIDHIATSAVGIANFGDPGRTAYGFVVAQAIGGAFVGTGIGLGAWAALRRQLHRGIAIVPAAMLANAAVDAAGALITHSWTMTPFLAAAGSGAVLVWCLRPAPVPARRLSRRAKLIARAASALVVAGAGYAAAFGYEIAVCTHHISDAHASLRACTRLIERWPSNNYVKATAFATRGAIHASLNEIDEAESDFAVALVRDPHNANALLSRGVTYRNRGRFDLAAADFSRLIAEHPDIATGYVARSILEYQQHDFEAALADADRAIALAPTPASYYGRGMIHAARNERDAAVADFRKAIVMEPRAEYARGALRDLGVDP